VRDCLRIGKIDCLSFLQTATKFSLHLHRANPYAGFAKGATFRIDESGFSNNRDIKISPFSFDIHHF
jgi:hypothetical protein